MIQLENGKYIIGFDDGYQLGKTANYVFDNGVHMLGSAEPMLQEKSVMSRYSLEVTAYYGCWTVILCGCKKF